MKDYVFVLLEVVIISGIIGMLSPETDIKKYISLLLCLCVLSVTVKPLGEIFESIGNAEIDLLDNGLEKNDYESVYSEYLLYGNEESFSELLESKMSRELNIPSEQLEIRSEMYVKDGEYLLKGITVELCGMGITQDPERLKSYIYGLFNVECEIVYA